MIIFVIDVGTSSMRGILYDAQAKPIFQQQILHHPTYLAGGRVEEDPADWESGLVRLARAAAQFCEARGQWPQAISLTAQRSSVLPLDAQGRPLASAIMWQDKRTVRCCECLCDYDDFVFSRAGSRINPVFSACKMSWMRQNEPGLYQKTRKFCVIPDYLLSLMTGRLCTDHTYGSRSLLMNLRERRWDPELLRLFAVEEDKLCELIPPGSVAGRLTPEFAKAAGLPSGIPVVSAGGDQQCAALGLGVIRQGDLEVTAGTGAYALAGCDRLPKELRRDVIFGAAAVPGGYILESSILTCCSAFDWFQRAFYPGEEDYRRIDAEAAASPAGANGVLLLPYFQGRATPDWNSAASATFHNLTLSATRGDLARAVLEGICYEVDSNIAAIGRYVGEIGEVKVCGGLTKSAVFNQMQADIYRRAVRKFSNNEATALGAWMSAAVAAGLCATYDEAFLAARAGDAQRLFKPKPQPGYDEGRVRFAALYRRIYQSI